MSQIRIGISGWRYPPWRGEFYPEGLPQREELHFASRQVTSIEINGSFYSLQSPKSYEAWGNATPDDFVFAVKGSRYITHLKRLRDIQKPLSNFFASGVLTLEEKLGPFLWQFPPSMKWDPDRFQSFVDLLPRTTRAAANLARKCDSWMKPRSAIPRGSSLPLRHAIEVRNPSFDTPEFFEMMKANDLSVVVADTAGKWPFFEKKTSDFIYVRLHGDEKIYVSGYTEAALKLWAKKVKAWSHGLNPRDVYIYFDNDVKVRAPYDAISLLKKTTNFVPADIERLRRAA